MKANEAPEKIWLNLIPHTEEVRIVYTEQPIGRYCKSIEYTRTDAFIEKAYNWLKNYAFVDDNKNVNLPTLLHDFLKDSRNF